MLPPVAYKSKVLSALVADRIAGLSLSDSAIVLTPELFPSYRNPPDEPDQQEQADCD